MMLMHFIYIYIFCLFSLKLAPLCSFFSGHFKSPPFWALESHCTSAKHHSCLPENKNRRERSGQRIKGQGGFVWQIAAGVLPVQTLSLSVFMSLYVHTTRSPPPPTLPA